MKFVTNKYNLIIVVYAALGSTSCAYALSVLGSIIGQPTFYTSLNLAGDINSPGYARTSRYLSSFAAVQSAGAIIGALITPWAADRFSRKHTIQAGATLMLVASVIAAASVNVAMFIIGRLLSGIAIGSMITCIPMYQAEISSPHNRGFMVCMHGVMFGVGYTLSSWLNFGLYFMTQHGSTSSFPWRFPMGFQGLPALLLVLGSPWLPYTPRWLLLKDRFDDAYEVMKKLHRAGPNHDDSLAQREFYQMRKQLEMDRQIKADVHVMDLFRTAANRRRCLVAAALMWFNQFTGVLVLANYGVILFQQLGLEGYMPLLLLGIWVTISIPGNISTALFVDRVGRRTVLLIGSCGIFVSLLCELVLQALYTKSDNRAGKIAAVFFIYFFVLFWSSCFDATQFLYMTEIFPNHLRALGTSWAATNQSIATLIIVVVGPIALNQIGWRFFFVLVLPTGLYIPTIYFFFPETAGRSLEEINEQFGDPVAIHMFDKKAVGKGETQDLPADFIQAECISDKVNTQA